MAKRLRVTGLHLALLAVVGVARSFAACPQEPCDCMGEARNFVVVVETQMRLGVVNDAAAFAVGDVCAGQSILSAPRTGMGNQGVASAGDIISPAPAGRVVAILLGNAHIMDLVTDGGNFIKSEDAQIHGVVDTSGTDPRLALCRQALLDVAAASATFAALTPTRDLGSVRVRGEDLILTADPGINVWTAWEIVGRTALPSYRGNISVERAPDTEAVIINTGKLSLSGTPLNGSSIYGVDVINVPGPGPAVTMKDYASIADGFLVAPERAVRLRNYGNQVYARSARQKNGDFNPDGCP